MKERLQKLLAQAGVASSRRDGETLIEQGRVRINGQIAKLGEKADPYTDVVEFDGRRLNIAAVEKVYIALNKPKHVLTTTAPHKTDDRQTVFDLVKSSDHLFSIGRLDADSEGLVVLTNDGDLAQRLSHPKYRHTKTYKVEVLGLPGQDVLDKWRAGIVLDENERTAPCVVILVDGDKKVSTLRIIMTEGRKRQIRRVGMKLGHQVKRLLRTHIGMLPLGELRPGESRELDARDIRLLSTPSPDLKLLKTPRRTKPSERRPSEARLKREAGTVSEDARPTRRISPSDRSEQRNDDERPARRRTSAHPGTTTRPAHRYPATSYGASEERSSDDDRPTRRSASADPTRAEGSGKRPARRYPSKTYGAHTESSGEDRPARRSSESRPPRTEERGDDDARSPRRTRPTGLPEGKENRSSDETDRPKGPRRPVNKSGKPSSGRPGGAARRSPRGGSGGKTSGGRPGAPSSKRRSDKKDRK